MQAILQNLRNPAVRISTNKADIRQIVQMEMSATLIDILSLITQLYFSHRACNYARKLSHWTRRAIDKTVSQSRIA